MKKNKRENQNQIYYLETNLKKKKKSQMWPKIC